MSTFATTDDLTNLWRNPKPEELERANYLLDAVSNELRLVAKQEGKNLDEMAEDPVYMSTLTSVVVEVVARELMTSTNQEPMTQFAESALGYSYSGSFLVPGGGRFIKRSDYERLGLKRQKYGVIDFYGTD
ncbi:MAG: phage Gp19/Gp15/Gp42 family protein [Eubacteriales bacterium]|nr:phage Gp19/Gp15/Gp42 family protein [Eubacteriales bacterium]